LVANWEPTELSKNPPSPEEDLEGADFVGAAFLGAADLVANWEPTELSKKPRELPTTQLLVNRTLCQFRLKQRSQNGSLLVPTQVTS